VSKGWCGVVVVVAGRPGYDCGCCVLLGFRQA